MVSDTFVGYYDLDTLYLSKVMFGECSICDDLETMMCGSVVLNRRNDGRWGSSICDVVYSNSQFHSLETDNWKSDKKRYEMARKLMIKGSIDSKPLYFSKHIKFFDQYNISIYKRYKYHIFGY
jgi:hypothetical protein